MSSTFTMTDLMAMLTKKAGLPVAAQTTDPTATFEDVDLDSLAFLAMQTELSDNWHVEMPDDIPGHYTFGQIVEIVQSQLTDQEVAQAS
jgi:acyl carrier protein